MTGGFDLQHPQLVWQAGDVEIHEIPRQVPEKSDDVFWFSLDKKAGR